MKTYLTQAVDSYGFPYWRRARIVDELPHRVRKVAMDAAVLEIAQKNCLPLLAPANYGRPIHYAFGLTSTEAKKHKNCDLLLMLGADLPLRGGCV